MGAHGPRVYDWARVEVASARPAAGNKADADVWRESDMPATASGAARPLLCGHEEDYVEDRRVRARVEHTFARMKTWKILRKCQRKDMANYHHQTTP